MKKIIYTAFISLCFLSGLNAQHKSCCELPKTHSGQAAHNSNFQMGEMTVPDVQLTDQEGKPHQFQELIKGKTVAINFVFTTCRTICPPMGANFAQLERLTRAQGVQLLSISIDPVTDTPERMKAWKSKFNAGPNWTMLTGEKAEVESLLKGLKVFTPLIEDHAPIALLGHEPSGEWIRTNGLSNPNVLAKQLQEYAVAEPARTDYESERKYFTDTPLINQHGEEMRFFTDLMQDKVVIIHPFFTECEGSCPVMAAAMQEIQTHLGDRLGSEAVIISISVDPETDKPAVVKSYAEKWGAQNGWYFLTGSSDNIHKVLAKLGQDCEYRENHKNIVLVGNVATRLWKKANGLAPPQDLIPIVEEVMADQGE